MSTGTTEPTSSSSAQLDTSVRIEADISPQIQIALQQMKRPVLHELRLHYAGDAPLRDLTLRITVDPAVAEPKVVRISRLDPDNPLVLPAERLRLDLSAERLINQSERESGRLRIKLFDGEKVIGRHSTDITLMAYNEWPGGQAPPETIAAFVTPNHRSIAKWLDLSRQELRKDGQKPRFEGYQSGDPQRVAELAAAIYGAVDRAQIDYANPPASFQQSGQKVRTADQVLEDRLATCLDISVLLASAMEQVGLHPLILFIEGHAFPGLWLTDWHLHEPATDDPTVVRKRIRLGECLVFDSSAAAEGVPFDQACKAGDRFLKDPATFHFFVDIKAARKVGVGPLRLQRESAYQVAAPAPAADPADASPAGQLPQIPKGRAVADQSSTDRIDNWKRHLLDMTLRNRLLNHKDTRTVLPLFGQAPGTIEDYLDIEEKLQLLPRTRAHLELDDDARVALIEKSGEQGRLIVDLPEGEFKKRAIEIYRRNRQIEQESGTSTLFLALGMLQWFESPSASTPRHAPLILMPITMERDSVAGPFRISRTDQEPLLNVSIVEKLDNEFGIQLPRFQELPQDDAGVDVDGILRAILHAIRDVDRFDIIWNATLAIYEFQKFMMWLDLEANTDQLMENPVVQHILEAEDSSFELAAPFPVPEELDRTRPAHQDLSVVEADSSQLSAVFAALDGNSFVLQGPPGTGKSQTITNMIAQLLGRGKTVLFVSEKRAALDVVEARLEQVGLGPFTLEVHSVKASRKAMADQLEQPFKYQWSAQDSEWKAHAARLQKERESLNAYADAIHRTGPFGESLFQALAQVVAGGDIPTVRLDFDEPGDRDRFLARQRKAQKLAAATATLGRPDKSPFFGSKLTEWSPDKERALKDQAEHATGHAEDFKKAITELVEATDFVAQPIADGAMAPVAQTTALLARSKSPTKAMLEAPRTLVTDTTADAVAYLERRQEKSETVDAIFRGDIYDDPELHRHQERLARWSDAFFLFALFALFFVRRNLSNYSRQKLPPNQQLANLLDNATDIIELDRHAGDDLDGFANLFGHHWRGTSSAPETLQELSDWTLEFRQALICLRENAPATDLDEARRLAINAGDELGAETTAGQAAKRLMAAQSQWEQAIPGLLETLNFPRPRWDKLSLEEQFSTARAWRDNSQNLRDWTDWNALATALQNEGLAALIDAVIGGDIDADHLADAFKKSFRTWWIEDRITTDDVLASFRGAYHEELISRFQTLDRQSHRLASREVQSRLAQRLPDRRAPGEMEILRREFKKKRAHKPIRKLFTEAPEVLRRIKPCMLMSPLSVARYLDPGQSHFDVVIFDEASQIPPWDAIGAVARAKQAIIVGDSRQLPPTNFFSAKMDDDFDEEDIVEFESILDQAIVSGVPEISLNWHYRSRHESLIAFSNHHYYDNRLHIFPSPHHEVPHLGVKWRHIEDGFYDRGRSRTNKAEAQAVAAEILRRLKDPDLCQKSIGVVTFSMAQQRCIEDLIDQARRDNPDIEKFFGDDPDSVFIKNLENVQGDQRDVMLFSIGYGPDKTGKVTMNFGPLNREGGERRLNVAVTRAKELLIIFSTLRADHIDLSRTQAIGVRHLKNFLKFAEIGDDALAQAVTHEASADFESPFERQVAQALTRAGWTVHSQVGVAGYRIDLAVVDPKRPGAYLMGVECDGATYHSAKNARDRDRIRQVVLESLGWNIHRIWSTEWWHNESREIQSMLDALEALNDAPRQTGPTADASKQDDHGNDPSNAADPSAPANPDEPAPSDGPLPPPREPEQDLDQPTEWPASADPFRAPTVPTADSDPSQTSLYAGDPATRPDLQRQLLAIINAQGPLPFEMAARAIGEAWDKSRLTKKVRRRVKAIITATDGLTLRDDEIWPADLSPADWSGFRYSDDQSPERDITDLVHREIQNALLWTVDRALSIKADDAMREVAPVFGFGQLGSRIRDTFHDAIEDLIAGGHLERNDEKLRLDNS